MRGFPLRRWRWYHWLLVACVVLYGVYVAFGYLYLPGKLQRLIRQNVAQQLGRTIQVGEIDFNPFRLSLDVHDLAIEDRPQLPLLGWRRLHVNADFWGSLFGLQARLSLLSLDGLRIHVEQRRDAFNFTDILQRLEPTRGSAGTEPEAQRLAVRIDTIQLHDGAFRFDDSSGKKPASSRIEQVDMSLQDLYLATGDDALNPFQLVAHMPGGGELRLTGDYRADPLLVHGTIDLRELGLPAFADFVANLFPVRLNGGQLSLQLRADIEQRQDAVQVSLHDGALRLHDLAIDDDDLDSPLLRGKRVEASGFELDLLQRSVRIDSVVLDGVETAQWLNDEGELRIAPLLSPGSDDGASTGQGTTNDAWSFALREARLENGSVRFSDFSKGPQASQTLSDIQLVLRDIDLAEGTSLPLQFAARVNQQGEAHAEGALSLKPFALALDFRLEQIALTPFNPYVEAGTWLHVAQGALRAEGHLDVAADAALPRLTLDAVLGDVQLDDARDGKKLLGWRELDVDRLQLDPAQGRLDIGRVALDQPDVSAELGRDGRMNLATLAREAGDEPAQATDEREPRQALAVRVDKASIAGGTVRFRDRSVKPGFRATLENLALEVDGLESSGSKAATFKLSTRVDRYAPFSLHGTLAPLQQQPGISFVGQLRGLEMPSLSPYSGTYIGYALKSGELSLDLDYTLRNHKLRGSNRILARQLYLGDTVASDKAVNAPVSLGLALLRDLSGNIDLDLGVSGDLDDPGFSVAGVVFKALVNVIIKTAASPFTLLGSLVGGAENLNQLAFAAGSAELDVDGEARLNQLVQALQQRPQLLLEVHGNAGGEVDTSALQLFQVRVQLAANRKLGIAEMPLETLLDDARNRNLLAELNAGLGMPDEADRKAALAEAEPSLDRKELEARVWQQMLQDVAGRQTVDMDRLLALADRRALAIKQYLVDVAGLDHERVMITRTARSGLKGNVCELGLQAR